MPVRAAGKNVERPRRRRDRAPPPCPIGSRAHNVAERDELASVQTLLDPPFTIGAPSWRLPCGALAAVIWPDPATPTGPPSSTRGGRTDVRVARRGDERPLTPAHAPHVDPFQLERWQRGRNFHRPRRLRARVRGTLHCWRRLAGRAKDPLRASPFAFTSERGPLEHHHLCTTLRRHSPDNELSYSLTLNLSSGARRRSHEGKSEVAMSPIAGDAPNVQTSAKTQFNLPTTASITAQTLKKLIRRRRRACVRWRVWLRSLREELDTSTTCRADSLSGHSGPLTFSTRG